MEKRKEAKLPVPLAARQKKSKRLADTSLLRNFLYNIIAQENRKIIRHFSAILLHIHTGSE